MRHSTKIRLIHMILAGMILLVSSTAEAFVFQDRVSTAKSLAHYAMGQIYDYLGWTNRAVLEYEKSLQFDDANYLGHLRLGTNYARLNMIDEAKQELKLVQDYNGEDLQSHYLLALIYSTEKEYDKAAGEYEHILKSFSEAEPQNIEIYGYLGQLYYSQKKFDQAIEQFKRILDLEPKNADVMYLLGSLYVEVNENSKAIDVLKQSIAIDPEHDGSLNTLGYVYAELNQNLDEAASLVERALKIDPENGAYLDSLGWVYFKKGNYKRALEVFKDADALLKDPVIYEHMGDVYQKLSENDEALKYWELSLKLKPDQETIIKKIDSVKNVQVLK